MVSPRQTDYPLIIAAGKSHIEIYSEKFASLDASELGFTGSTTGTITATFELQGTNKLQPNEANDDDWFPLGDAHGWCDFPTVPTGAPWKDARDVASANLFFYRFKLVLTAGTGTWSADVTRKGIG